MAHFAQIDADDVVQQVIIIANSCLEDKDFPLSEPLGQAFIADTLGFGGVWKQTSYNTHYVYEYEYDDSDPPKTISSTIIGSAHRLGGTPFRGTYAGIGYTYDAVTDTFTPPVVEDAPE
jgi:hypothetical protein